MSVKFPSNPSDGLLFEPVPGILYVWNAGQSTWARVPLGVVPLATPVRDGLMSKEDLDKLLGIILPPPQSTLQGEDCDLVFDSGTVCLTSTDNSLEISPNLSLGQTSQAWSLHENTAGYDWRLDFNQFIQEVTALGNITKTQISGTDGFKGATGEAGIDKLDTGPVGKTGDEGANSPFSGSVTAEPSSFEIDDDKQNRAIVGITTEEADDDENYVVITRANIGNPDACPTGLRPQDFDSPWILVLDQKEGSITRRLESTGDCAITCRICVSQVYYLNIETIIETIHTRFQARLDQLVFDKEKVVRDWLRVMSRLFTEQKYALCCALENCKTRQRNQDVRRYLEQSRIAAAQAKQSLVISSSEEDKLTVPSDQECELDEDGGETTGGTNARVVYGEECEQYLVTMSLSARLHNTDPRTGSNGRWLEARLAPGDYLIEILDCCANFGRKLKPRAVPLPSPPPPTPPPAPPQAVIQPTQPTPPPRQFVVPSAPQRIYLGTLTHQDGITTEDLYNTIPGGNSIVQIPPPNQADVARNRALGYGPNRPVPVMAPSGGPGGAVPPGLRVPFSNTPGGRLSAGQLACNSQELTGRIGHQPGDTPSPHYSGYISNDCKVVHGFMNGSDERAQGCIPKVCPETTVEDTSGTNLSQTNKYTGQVALLHFGNIPGNATDSVRHYEKVTQFPAIGPRGGYFEDLFAARTGYIGLTEIFNHSGGLIKVWIPDPDKLSANNDGGIVVGVRSRKCVEDVEELGTDVTLTIPTLYIYRGTIEPENLVGSLDPYLSDLSHTENYDITSSDGSARLSDGPLLEPEVSKLFFVLANDGLGFYHVHHATTGSNKVAIIYEPGPSRTMRPISTSQSGWTAQNCVALHDCIDEATPSDVDYVFAQQPSSTWYNVGMTSLPDYEPFVNVGHVLRWRTRIESLVDDPITLSVEILDSSLNTLVAVRGGVILGTTWTTHEYELTDADVEAILASTSKYDGLVIRFGSTGYVNDVGVQTQLSWAELELPASKVAVETTTPTEPNDFTTTIFSKYLVEGNPDPVDIVVGDDFNDVTKSIDPQGELFSANWTINNETDGVVLNPFTTDEDDDWIITLDEMDFGDIEQLVASSATGEELVLSQDVHGYPVPKQTDDVEPFILCRALSRSCNVQEGFGGRWSLGVVNRVKGVNFRICNIIPEWTLPPLTPGGAITPGLRDPKTGEIVEAARGPEYSWIRKPYIYAPQGQPCGTSYCNVKWQYVIGSDGEVIPINRDVDAGPEIDGSRVNIAFVIDQSSNNAEAFDYLGDRADDIMEYFRNSGVEEVSASVVTFGGDELGGDPVLRQDFTDDNATVTDAIDAAAPVLTTATSGDAPGLSAIQYSIDNLNWASDAVKVVLFVTYDGTADRSGITVSTVDAALKARPIVLFGVVSAGSVKFGIPNDTGNPSDGGTGLCYDNLGTLFFHEEMRNASLTESLIKAPGAPSYWDQQPFIDFRIGVGNTNGSGVPMPYDLTQDALDVIQSSNGYYTITGRWLGGVEPNNPSISGALVHLKSSITGSTIVASQITDNEGRFAFQVPVEFFPNDSVTFTVDLEMYNERFIDTDGEWEIKVKSTNADATQKVHISGGGLSEYGQDTIYSASTMAPKLVGAVDKAWSVRGVYSLVTGTGGDGPSNFDIRPDALQRVANLRSEDGEFAFDIEFDDTPGGDLDFNDLVLTCTYKGTSSCTAPTSEPVVPVHTTSRQIAVENIYRQFVSNPSNTGTGLVPATNCCGISVFTSLTFTANDVDTVKAGYSECGGNNGFLQRLADAILGSIRAYEPELPHSCGADVSGGPATEYSKVEGIPMNAETLEGRILSIQASILALPGTAIQCTVYDTQSRGIRMRSISTLPASAWEWHSWQVDNIDAYINPIANSIPVIEQIGNWSPGGSVNPGLRDPAEQSTSRQYFNNHEKKEQLASRTAAPVQQSNFSGEQGSGRRLGPPASIEAAIARGDSRLLSAAGRLDLFTRGLAIKLKDLSSLSFEFINPDTGAICFFGSVRAAVEVVTNDLTGATKVVLVDLANFEPFKEAADEPGEIPLAVYGRGVPADPTDAAEDGSANAVAGLTMTANPTAGSRILIGGPIRTGSGEIVGGSAVVQFVDTLIIDPNNPDYPGNQVLIGATVNDTLTNLCDFVNDIGLPDVTWNNAIQTLNLPVWDLANTSDITCTGVSVSTANFQAVTTGIAGNSHQAKVILDSAGVMTFSSTETFQGGIDVPLVEVPVVRIDPSEEDYSAYLERFWTISQPDDDPSDPDECSRWKEFCPDCTVVKCESASSGGVQRQLVECVDKTTAMKVPLTKYLITPIAPCESCQMHWKQVEWYERGWRTKACCGAYVEIDGVQWIVVKRSIGIDDTCGGGESENTPCIKTFLDAGQGHPAIAWPTVDGEEFIGRPLSGFARFVKDPGLSDQLIEAITGSSSIRTRGDLTSGNVAERIPFILFPRSI